MSSSEIVSSGEGERAPVRDSVSETVSSGEGERESSSEGQPQVRE